MLTTGGCCCCPGQELVTDACCPMSPGPMPAGAPDVKSAACCCCKQFELLLLPLLELDTLRVEVDPPVEFTVEPAPPPPEGCCGCCDG